MLGIAAMLASCSNEDVLQGGGESNGLLRITAQLENGMKTRAADDENSGINRYVLEVYTIAADGTETKDEQLSTSNATGTFDLQLDRSENYRFYCWADEGEQAYNVDNGLANITLNQGINPTIAHRGWTEEIVSGSTSGPMDIPMKHAVAKVVLKTTTSLGVGEAKVETGTYTQYNAITNEYTEPATEKVSGTGPEADITITDDGTPVEALSFYILTDKVTQAVDLKYTPAGGTDTYTYTLDNVPFEADCRTILTGDLEGLWFNTASVTATLDEDWTDENKLNMDGYMINLTEETTLTSDMLANALGDGNIVAVKGTVTEESMETVFSWLKGGTIPADGVNLDLSGATTATGFDYIGVKNAGTPNLSQDLSFSNSDADRTKLRSIILPKGLKTIGQNAFYHCENLTSVTLPQGLERISNHPFIETGITEIDLPPSVVSANLNTTPDLEIVHIRGNIESFNAWDFSLCGSLTDIYFHGNTTAPSSESVSGGVNRLFEEVDKSQITIHIPASANIEDWKASDTGWEDFKFEYIKE